MPSPYSKNKSTALPLPFEDGNCNETAIPSKKCKSCDLVKPLSEYHPDRDGWQLICKICARYKSKVRAKIRKFAPPRSIVCDCCGEIPQSRWCMDHDHERECFRGWICERCNIGLGKFGDNIEGLTKAIDYLKRTTEQKKEEA